MIIISLPCRKASIQTFKVVVTVRIWMRWSVRILYFRVKFCESQLSTVVQISTSYSGCCCFSRTLSSLFPPLRALWSNQAYGAASYFSVVRTVDQRVLRQGSN